MSKQSEAKLAQGYEPKPVPKVCGNCAYYQSEIITEKVYFGEYTSEKEKRCGIGGFAVKKMATCNQFEEKQNEAQ